VKEVRVARRYLKKKGTGGIGNLEVGGELQSFVCSGPGVRMNKEKKWVGGQWGTPNQKEGGANICGGTAEGEKRVVDSSLRRHGSFESKGYYKAKKYPFGGKVP